MDQLELSKALLSVLPEKQVAMILQCGMNDVAGDLDNLYRLLKESPATFQERVGEFNEFMNKMIGISLILDALHERKIKL